ncbi:hypothetical protein SKAU_G00265160 [Synaphobranchus kaupii]|uniref:Uncharacterized protein n=1 Tax=Synaphobranchus kaupii TaxID=118154 RepID=A0A9Q1IPT2_SYNKA|nr:hypothetical protein SKAU_G00265160 [Synaphobranchus kaupii]
MENFSSEQTETPSCYCLILTKRREKGEKTTGWDLNNSHTQALSIRIEKRAVCDAVDKLRGEADWRSHKGR